MPTLRRIRSPGTSSAVPATDAWVIRPGCSIRHSTPPSDSPRVNTSALAADVDGVLLAAGDPERHDAAEPLHLPGRDVVAGVVGQARVVDVGDGLVTGQELDDPLGVVAVPVHPHAEGLEAAQHQPRVERARPRRPWRSGGRRPARRAPGRAPRRRRRRRRSARRRTWSSSAATTSAPRVSGVWRYGDAKVLSTTSSAPASWATAAIASMSPMLSSGLVGVSTQTSRVSPGRMAARTASRSEAGAGSCRSPQAVATLSNSRKVPPYASSGSTTWSPGPAQRADHGVLGGQAAGEREPALALLQGRDVALEGGAGGVGGAAVLVAAAQPAHAVLLVGRGRVDRRDHRRRSSASGS